jgi:protein O-GlcNAc transferase
LRRQSTSEPFRRRACGHVFTDGYFDANAASIGFATTQPNQTVGSDMERQRPVSARIVARVARRMPEGRWLAVGSGNGSLLFTAEEWGFTPAGLDLRVANVRALKQLGYEAHCLPIEVLDHNACYSVISMADLLEHMPFPKPGLAAAHRLLRPEAMLFFSMPEHGLEAAARQQGQALLGRDRALSHFSRKRLMCYCKTMAYAGRISH